MLNNEKKCYLDKFFPYLPGEDARVLSLELFDSGFNFWCGNPWLRTSNHAWSNRTRLLGESYRCFIIQKAYSRYNIFFKISVFGTTIYVFLDLLKLNILSYSNCKLCIEKEFLYRVGNIVFCDLKNYKCCKKDVASIFKSNFTDKQKFI